MRVMLIIFLNDAGRMMGLTFTFSLFFGGSAKGVRINSQTSSGQFPVLLVVLKMWNI